MGTLNPDLISKDVDAVLNDAVTLKDNYRKPMLMPELVLLALLRRKDTAAARLLDLFKTERAVDMDKLDRKVHLAVEQRRDQDGSLDFPPFTNWKNLLCAPFIFSTLETI